MAPAPAPAPAPATAPAVGVEVESAMDQNSKVVVKSEDVSSMRGLKQDGELPVPCSEPASDPGVAPVPVEDKGGDTTESSSSFGDTFSGFDDEEDGGEPEVTSHTLAPTDEAGSSMLPRRKKVTAEWKNAVRPLMWRCQWLKLRMNDLYSQVSRYDRELALIEKEKEQQQAEDKTNGSTPDAMLIGKDHRNSSMMRIKRKRHEDIADTSLYIKKHQILSYYNDKQNKGVETDGIVLDDDCSSRGGPDTVALLDAEEYDVIFEQVSLNNILSTIDGVKSRVHLLQDRLKKAHLQEDNSAFSEDDTQVRAPRKRQSTQKFCDTSYMKEQNTKSQKYRNAKPQKKKNLNILLKDDDGPALAVKPCFPDSGTNCRIEDAKGYSGGKSGELNHSEDRAIAMNLLLGVDNSLPNGYMGDLCKQNADDILIDNQIANEGYPQFEKIEHMPSETSYTKGQNTSAPVEVRKTSAPLKVDASSSPLKVDASSSPLKVNASSSQLKVDASSSPLKVDASSSPLKVDASSAPLKVDASPAPLKGDGSSATVFNQELLLEKMPMLKPVKKRDWKPRERKNGWGSASSALNHSKGASATSDSEQKSKDAPPSSTVKTESAPTAPMDPEIMMTPLAAWKKRKAGNKSATPEKDKDGNLASKKQKSGTSAGDESAAPKGHKMGDSASKNQKTVKSSSAVKKRKTENSLSAAKNQETENSSPAAKTQKTESNTCKVSTKSSSKLMVEKAVLVTLSSRRSERVRKPKVYN